MQSHHLQGAYYPCLLKLHLFKIVSIVHWYVIKSVVMWLHILVVSLLMCMSHCSEAVLPKSAKYTHQQGHYQYMQPQSPRT